MPRTWLLLLVVTAYLAGAISRSAEEVGPFFELEFPFFQSPVDLAPPNGKGKPAAPNVVVRGIVLPLADGHTLLFDQELLRIAAWWRTPAGQPPVSLRTMAQASYREPHRKAGADHPKPAGPVLLGSGWHPGVATSVEGLFGDPRRPGASGENGRGPLPVAGWRFEGIELCGKTAVLRYRCGDALLREWHEARPESVLRHFEFSAHRQPIFFAVAKEAGWQLSGRRSAIGTGLSVATNSDAFSLTVDREVLIAELAPSNTVQRVSLALGEPSMTLPGPTPSAPASSKNHRWPQSIQTSVALDAVTKNGLALDRFALPEANPWRRRVRPADIDFLSPDRAAVVTYDGDVWLVDGFAATDLGKVTWRRYASGLNEPLALAVVGRLVQVATKNGLVRLHDRDGDGEADWYQNFSDAMLQSQSTRSFSLDMDLGPDGSSYVSQGGIPLGGRGTEFTGAIAQVSPEGRTARLFATHAREPYVTVHPQSGIVTGSDQQGNFVPSSVCYLVRSGDDFGYGAETPAKLTPPLAWIPHTEDSSSSSQVWLTGSGLGALRENLLHLSYGKGTAFLISPDLQAPTPQAAVIPLGLETNIPLLQARMHPQGGSVFVSGFQIYDSRTTNLWALGRLRLDRRQPLTIPVSARSCRDGVILTFASPLRPESVLPDRVAATAWNYRRSKEYGSGRFTRGGSPGSDPLPVGQVILSSDRKAVFVHLPDFAAVMQLEVRHEFALADGTPAVGVTYYTVHQLRDADLARAGFPGVDLSKSVSTTRQVTEPPPTVELGRSLSQSMGCVGCHSIDGTTAGKTGPSWKGLFGIDRKFTDGSIESANEFYLRTSILDPQQKVVDGFAPGMASYRGVLTEKQIDALVMYIRSLQ